MKRIFILAALLLSHAAIAQPIPAPAATQLKSNPAAALAALSQSPSWRPVSLRETYPSNFSSVRDSKKSFQMTRLWTQLSARSALPAIKLCYANFGGVASGVTTEGDAANTLTLTASVEVNSSSTSTVTWSPFSSSNLLPAFFNGNRSVSISPGGFVCSDPIYYPFVASQYLYTRTYYGSNGTGTFPTLRSFQGSASFTEYVNNAYFSGASLSTSTTAVTTVSGTVTSGGNIVTLPLVPGTLSFYSGTITGYATDDGAGNITGTGVATGSTVNYTTGAVTLNLTTATAPNSILVLGYGASGTTPPDDTLNNVPSGLVSTAPTSGVYGPSLILGLTPNLGPAQPLGLLAVGDSIIYGSGDTTNLGESWVTYSTITGLFRAGQPSETAASFAQGIYSRRRLSMAQRLYDRAIEDYGTNDMYSTSLSLATLEASKLAIWSQLASNLPHGYKDIWAVPIMPRTVSAASQTPLNTNYGSGTVAGGTPSLRNAYNAWLCSQVGVTIGGIIDVNLAVENNPGTCAGSGDGQWKSLSLTLDGTHPNNAGNNAIAGVVGVNGTSPSPAFAP